MGIRENKKILHPAVLIGCIAFYVCFIIVDGPVVCVDSPSYIQMDISREAAYPLYLLFFRTIFSTEPLIHGEARYLFFAALAAAVVNGYAAFRVGAVAASESKREGFSRPAFAGSVMIAFQLAVSLLNRFAAKRGSMYAESIMTESLAMPIFVLFTIQLYLWMRRKRIRHALCLFLLMLLLLLIRSQMLVAPATFLTISFLYDVLGKNRRFRHFAAAVLLCAGAYVLSIIGNCAYNYLYRGVWMDHTLGNKALYSTAMYTAAPEDADLFGGANADERTLFLKLLDNCESQELNIRYAPENADLITLADDFSWCYDDIGFGATMPEVNSYIDERLALYNGAAPGVYTGNGIDFSDRLTLDENGQYVLTEPMRAAVYDDVIAVINGALMHRRPPLSIRVFIANVVDGLMNSVARTMYVLRLPVVIIYALFLLLWLLMRLKGRSACALAAEIVLLGMFINIASVSLIMYAQSRYMIYSMGLFYGILLIMLVNTWSFFTPGQRG